MPCLAPRTSHLLTTTRSFPGRAQRIAAAPPYDCFPPPTHNQVPSARDATNWRLFINGRRVKKVAKVANGSVAQVTNSGSAEMSLAEAKLAALASLELDAPSPANEEEEEEEEEDAFDNDYPPHPPSPALLLTIDQLTLIQVLSHLNDWLIERQEAHEAQLSFIPSTIFAPPALLRKAAAATSAGHPSSSTSPPKPVPPPPRPPLPTHHEAHWILSILARLDSLLASDDISTLRTLVKTLLDLLDASSRVAAERDQDGVKRSKEDEIEAEKTALCWMIVAAVANTWGQADLWNSNLW